MRHRIAMTFLPLLAVTLTAEAQMPTLPTNCPYQFVIQLPSGAYQYKTKNCMTNKTGFGESSTQLSLVSPACDGFSCQNQTTQGGGGEPDVPPEPIPEPQPMKNLPPEPPAFNNWKEVAKYFTPAGNMCRPGFISVQPVRALAKSKLTLPGAKAAKLEKLKKSVPAMLKRYVAAPTWQKQMDVLEEFNTGLFKLVSVEVEIRSNSTNRFTGIDLPRPALTKNATPPKEKATGSLKSLGVVEVADGDQTFFFELFETTVPETSSVTPIAPAVLRSGSQVDAPASDASAGKATFVGKNHFTHKVRFGTHDFLVTSKSKRVVKK